MDTVPAWLVYVLLWSPLVLILLGVGIFVWRRGNRDHYPVRQLDEAVRYIEALSDALDKTNHAQNRKPLVDHLAEAARLVALLHRGAEAEVIRAWVESEEHGFGWGYLEGKEGQRAEAAFDRLRRKLSH